MTNQIQLPASVIDSVRTAMGGDDNAAALPFIAPLFWVVNGNRALSQLGDNHPSFTGGWATTFTDPEAATPTLDKCQDEYGPIMGEASEIVEKYGKTLAMLRTLTVAVIGTRRRYVDQEGNWYTEWAAGRRSHQQWLVALMHRPDGDKGGFQYWGPAVLSAKGTQSANIYKALQYWEKSTAAARNEIAPGVPANFFALPLGTFGKATFVEVGKHQTSEITPIVTFEGDMPAAKLAKVFVGNDTAAIMSDLALKAKDWLEAWDVQIEFQDAHDEAKDTVTLTDVEDSLGW